MTDEPLTRYNWHQRCTQPPLTDEERADLGDLTLRMTGDPDLAAYIDRVTATEAAAFDDLDIGLPGYAVMIAKQDACRRLLRAQLAALTAYTPPTAEQPTAGPARDPGAVKETTHD